MSAPLTRELYDKVVALVTKGHPPREIQQMLDLTRNECNGMIYRLREWGILPRLKPKVIRILKNPLHKPVKAAKPQKPPARAFSASKPSKPQKEEKPPVAHVYVAGKGKEMVELAWNECHFSIGQDAGKYLFCAAPGYPYCDYHRAKVTRQRNDP